MKLEFRFACSDRKGFYEENYLTGVTPNRTA